MEDSQRLIDKIQRKDKISRYILIALFIMNIAVVWWAVAYVLDRVNKFERTIDCKLLIIPEDRTKAKFMQCSELNKDNYNEIINGEEKPSFKSVDDSDKDKSVISLPKPVQPLPILSVTDEPAPPVSPPKEPTPIKDNVKEVVRTTETITDPVNGELQKREEDTIWQIIEP